MARLSLPEQAFLRKLARIDDRDRKAVYAAYRDAFGVGEDMAAAKIAQCVSKIRGKFEAFDFLENERGRAEQAQAAAAARDDTAMFDRDKALVEMEQAAIETVTGALRSDDKSARGTADLANAAVKILARTKQGKFDAAALRQKAALYRQLTDAKKQRDDAAVGSKQEDPPIIAPGQGYGTA